jgi:hypothetical protein
MDSIYRGPIHSQFAMIVNGLVTLRSYERINYFRQHFIDDLEKSTNITFSYNAINRWMATMLDAICLSFALAATIFSVFYGKGRINVETLAFSF